MHHPANTITLVAVAIVLWFPAAAIIVLNWVLLIRGLLGHRTGSMAPLVASMLWVIGLILAHPPVPWFVYLIPILIDPGSGLAIACVAWSALREPAVSHQATSPPAPRPVSSQETPSPPHNPS
jgi:hypothetical protein